MDVICDRCSTEYEFEEALVSTRGTTVKCTHCGHLFKVYRADNAAVAVPAGKGWTVRHADGSREELPTLADITRLISAGQLSRDDEMSRTGKAWRRLGEVDELEPFFGEAERRRSSRAPASVGLERDIGDGLSADEQSSALFVRPSVGPQRESDAEPGPSVQLLEAGIPPPPSAPASFNPPPVAAGLHTSTPGPITFPLDDELQASDRAQLRRSAWPWLITVAFAIVAVALWFHEPPRAAPPSALIQAPREDPSVRFAARAEHALDTHRVEQFDDALTDSIKALAFHEDDAHLLSMVARVHSVWAQELTYNADPGASRSAAEAARHLEWLAQTNEAKAHALAAKRYAESGARKHPDNAEAEIALTDALRLNGDVAAARGEYNRALAADHSPSAESLRVAALLAIAEAGGDGRTGLTLASQAVARAPELIRTRLLLARCLTAAGDFDGARNQVQEVLKRSPDHPAARTTELWLNRAAEVVRVTAATPKAAPTVPEPAPQAPLPIPAQAQDSSVHDGFIAHGHALLEAGQVSQAKKQFEQALIALPNSAQAHVGLAQAALDRNRVVLAAEHLSAATRNGDDEAWFALAEAYRRLGRNREALRAYQNYASRNPDGEQLSAARTQVDRLSEELAQAGRKAQ